MTDEAEDHARMGQALALAARVLGQTWPNPAVGCVIGREGRVLGRGHTQPSGRPHAEQVALAQARTRHGAAALHGATAWITLEPCAHHGRTPPCADALVAAGIARVVAAIRDPDPRVNGAGFDRLRAAGVAVETGCRAAEATRQQAGFLSRIQRDRPWLTLKLAATLDGRIATASGESRWITGPDSRARVHLMRAMSDAVLIGGGTARADDPMLDVRLPGLTDRRPVRVVTDSMLTLEAHSRLVHSAAVQPLWLLHGEEAAASRREGLLAQGVRVMAVRLAPEGGLDPRAMLETMGEQGLTRVLCEGGGALAASLLRAALVDELVLFTAGKAIGADGRPALAELGLAHLAEAPPFTLERVERLGGDVLTHWRAGAAG